MRLTIECEPEQVQLIIDCLEESFRFRMKQGNNFLDKILFELYPGIIEDKEAEDRARRRWFEKRDCSELMCKALLETIYGKSNKLPESTHNISDMWSCLRHALYMVDHDGTDYMDVLSDKPIQIGDLPLIKCEVEL